MKNRLFLVVVLIVVSLSVSTVMCRERDTRSQDHVAEPLRLRIGPVLDVEFDESTHSWAFDLAIKIQNDSGQFLFVPNPIDLYMGSAFIHFFLLDAEGSSTRNNVFEIVPILSRGTWSKLEAGESIDITRRVVIIQSSAMTAVATSPPDGERLKEIRFVLDKEVHGEYKLLAEFSYDGQHSRWHEKWLTLTQRPHNEAELSRFWRGKIESDYLSLNLEKQKD